MIEEKKKTTTEEIGPAYCTGYKPEFHDAQRNGATCGAGSGRLLRHVFEARS